MSTSTREALRGRKDSCWSAPPERIFPFRPDPAKVPPRIGTMRRVPCGVVPRSIARPTRTCNSRAKTIRTDGVAEISARYVLQTHSGDLIHVINSGIRRGRPEVMAQLNSGHEVNSAEYYFRTAPRFESSVPSCAWLMQSIFVGWGQRRPSKVIISVWKLL
jgi:Protein of unknown function (DUF3237)